MADRQIVRPKITNELRYAVLKIIKKFPEISSVGIIMMLIGQNYRNAIFFYTKPIGNTFILDDLYKIYTAKTDSEAKRLYLKLIKNRGGELSLNPGVINRIKTWLNRNHAPEHPEDAIYGASQLGYVVESALTPNLAAKWLRPRLSQQQHECMHTRKAIEVISEGADSPERRKVADLLKIHSIKAVVYNRIKACNDGLKYQYLYKRN